MRPEIITREDIEELKTFDEDTANLEKPNIWFLIRRFKHFAKNTK